MAIPDVQRVRQLLRQAGYPVHRVREAAVVRWQQQGEGKLPLDSKRLMWKQSKDGNNQLARQIGSGRHPLFEICHF
ncbi:MAG: hypothetical protein OT477_13000 [Chloroflexi bacterium]|nr:hypothetical protein [Chloroflexota bacterium]